MLWTRPVWLPLDSLDTSDAPSPLTSMPPPAAAAAAARWALRLFLGVLYKLLSNTALSRPLHTALLLRLPRPSAVEADAPSKALPDPASAAAAAAATPPGALRWPRCSGESSLTGCCSCWCCCVAASGPAASARPATSPKASNSLRAASAAFSEVPNSLVLPAASCAPPPVDVPGVASYAAPAVTAAMKDGESRLTARTILPAELPPVRAAAEPPVWRSGVTNSPTAPTLSTPVGPAAEPVAPGSCPLKGLEPELGCEGGVGSYAAPASAAALKEGESRLAQRISLRPDPPDLI